MSKTCSGRGDVVTATTPRHASTLLLSGDLRNEDHAAVVARLHDQIPHPRVTLHWGCAPDPRFTDPVVVDADADPLQRARELHRELFSGQRASEPDILPDKPPAPSHGGGDHGQGGNGMIGGVPDGGPMAMTDEAVRDGLSLDANSAVFGPFLPQMPPGLVLDLTLQADVIVGSKLMRPPYDQPHEGGSVSALRSPSRQLQLMGLSGHAYGLARAAVDGSPARARRPLRHLRLSGALAAIPRATRLVSSGRNGSWSSAYAHTLAASPSANARATRWASGVAGSVRVTARTTTPQAACAAARRHQSVGFAGQISVRHDGCHRLTWQRQSEVHKPLKLIGK